MKGQLIVISGPSGVGKGTIVNKLIEKRQDYVLSISATTRKIRSNERENESYFFKSLGEFKSMIENGELLEYAEVHGNYYGTPRKYVNEKIKENKTVILEIDIQGGMQVKKSFPDTVLLFILPPHFSSIEKRLRNRGTETADNIKVRLETARKELKFLKHYDFAVVNDNLDECVNEVEKIIDANKYRIDQALLEKYENEVN